MMLQILLHSSYKLMCNKSQEVIQYLSWDGRDTMAFTIYPLQIVIAPITKKVIKH